MYNPIQNIAIINYLWSTSIFVIGYFYSLLDDYSSYRHGDIEFWHSTMESDRYRNAFMRFSQDKNM